MHGPECQSNGKHAIQVDSREEGQMLRYEAGCRSYFNVNVLAAVLPNVAAGYLFCGNRMNGSMPQALILRVACCISELEYKY